MFYSRYNELNVLLGICACLGRVCLSQTRVTHDGEAEDVFGCAPSLRWSLRTRTQFLPWRQWKITASSHFMVQSGSCHVHCCSHPTYEAVCEIRNLMPRCQMPNHRLHISPHLLRTVCIPGYRPHSISCSTFSTAFVSFR